MFGICVLEKWVVKIGGGENYWFVFYDMIMLKDNYIDFCGGIIKVIDKIKVYLKWNKFNLKIIVEVRSLDEIEEILKSDGVYWILIDNFNYEDIKKVVKMIGDKCFIELSGGIILEIVWKYLECGVNYIFSGVLMYLVYNMDLSLKVV